MVVLVPLGSYLGLLYGWRIVFLSAAGLGLVMLLAQSTTFPRLESRETTQFRTLLGVMRRPGIGLAMGGIAVIFGCHFALFTYLRPYLEHVAALSGDAVSIIFMTFGIANLLGTVLAGWLMARSLRVTLSLLPLLMGLAALAMALAQLGFVYTAGAVAIWGIAYGAFPVSWLAYVARLAPDETESGGGLVIAAVQLSIVFGAAGGGVIETFVGDKGVFGAAGVIALAASTVIYARITDVQPS